MYTDTVRYLSLHDNKYLRYFPGHIKRLVRACVCIYYIERFTDSRIQNYIAGIIDNVYMSINCRILRSLIVMS